MSEPRPQAYEATTHGSSPQRPVVLACAHGTRDVRGQECVSGFVAGLRAGLPQAEVVETWVDVQEPGLEQRTAEFTGREVTVLPLLLSAGYHVRVDMARAVDGRTAQRVAAALGPDPRLARLMARRLHKALADHPGGALNRQDTVIMAAAGSSREEAVRECEEAAHQLGTELGVPVNAAYLSAAGPRLSDAVQDAHGRVLVASYLLAPGHFHDRAMAAGAAVTTAPLLTTDDMRPGELVEIARDRLRVRGTEDSTDLSG